LAAVSRGTAKRWLTGYAYLNPQGERVELPPVTPGLQEIGAVSFIDLIEIVAIGGFKEMGFTLRQIRRIVVECQQELGVPRPLTTLKFKSDGKDIFLNEGEVLRGVGRRKGQLAWTKFLQPFLQELDYSEAYASRWWPLGKDKPIVVDPDYGFGLPVVFESGVRTEIILERFEAGDLHGQIAEDFNLRPVDVERALQFELKTRVA
jgi:uncharacterized protein (DUF433 family)